MRYRMFVWLITGVAALSASCGKDKKNYASVSTALMRPEKASTSSLAIKTEKNLSSAKFLTGSTVQSFTPTSFKIPIYRVALCKGETGGCNALYTCSGSTKEECNVELSDIDAFVDALNAAPADIEDGGTFSHISVEYCSDADRAEGIQNLSIRGTLKIQGVDYATHPASGLVAGTTAQDVTLPVKGGCGSFYALTEPLTVSAGTPIKVTLFFDPSLELYGAIGGGGMDPYMAGYSDTGCVGDKSTFLCIPGITIVPTIDSGTPTTERYLLTETTTDANSSPTGKVILYFSSDGKPIGGTQSSYRMSGANVTWGSTYFIGSLGLLPKNVDATTVSFGEPEGSVSLAYWFKNFKRDNHSGSHTYAAVGGVAKEGTYTATKL